MNDTATLTGLFFYPVKSARGIATPSAETGTRGLQWDRQWMIVDESLRFLTQRTHPHLTLIVPRMQGGTLILSAPGLPELSVSSDAPGETLKVTVWKDTVAVTAQGAEADAWVTRAVRQPVRLVRVAQHTHRVANPAFAGKTEAPIGFPDGYPFLVCNAASLTDLNTRLPAPIPIERFRPNLLLEGLPAWAEDRIDTLTFESLTLRLVKPCTRCAIPSFDHLTGKPSINPLPVLKRFRFNKELLGVTFGENAVMQGAAGARVRVGEQCRVSYRS
jgi:uncharacterized protein YcbX